MTCCALIVCFANAGCGASDAAKAVPDISHEELVAAIKAKQVVLLDANGSESYKKGHLPGAIDYTAGKADLKSALPADKQALVVAYCGGPQCGAYKEAAEAASALGYANVKHYSGGLKGWTAQGAELEKQ
ncbi:MAG: rhodanese-like domain-containing protein [Planctomycetes bacterium]|nr:rhodanese-like domain-containing protein [Planctomycetota bacterium]